MNLQQLEPIGPSFEPVRPESISNVDKRLGRRLPDDYRDFLAHWGRCGFAGEACVVTDTGRFPIFTFYGGGNEEGSLLQQLELHPDLCEIGVLPIADDMFNNLYVLDVEKGGVARLDYSTGRAVATRIADAFSDFLGRIVVQPDEPL